MKASLFIEGPLPGMNEIIAAAKGSGGRGVAYASMKRAWTDTVWALAKSAGLRHVPSPVAVSFIWFEEKRNRDVDNISAGAKFVLDGLVKAGVLEGDGQKHVATIAHRFTTAAGTGPGVMVDVETIEG